MSHEIGLGEFITKVKEDLKPTQEAPIFFVEKAELVIHVAVSKADAVGGDIKGKFDFKINVLGADLFKLAEAGFDAEASERLQRQDVHTIKVTLTPLLTKEEMLSALSQEELNQIRGMIKKKIMRGEREEKEPGLSQEISKDTAISRKVIRG